MIRPKSELNKSKLKEIKVKKEKGYKNPKIKVPMHKGYERPNRNWRK